MGWSMTLVAVARVDDDAMRAEFPQEEFGSDFVGGSRCICGRRSWSRRVWGVSVPCRGEPGVVTSGELALRAPLLVDQMRAGAFRAGLLQQELSDAPAPVVDEIVMRLVARADRVGRVV